MIAVLGKIRCINRDSATETNSRDVTPMNGNRAVAKVVLLLLLPNVQLIPTARKIEIN